VLASRRSSGKHRPRSTWPVGIARLNQPGQIKAPEGSARRTAKMPLMRKATLDAVMLDALRILAEFGLRDDRDTLRSVGSPLIAFGYPLAYSPRLGPRSLMIIGERLGRQAAEAIVERIPEIKGVIHSRGVPGIRGSLTMPMRMCCWQAATCALMLCKASSGSWSYSRVNPRFISNFPGTAPLR